MIVLHVLLLFSLLVPTLLAPNLSQTLAKINEAKVRAAANRAKMRAHSARIMNQLGTPLSSRSRRQDDPDRFDNAAHGQLSDEQELLGIELDRQEHLVGTPLQGPEIVNHIIQPPPPQQMMPAEDLVGEVQMLQHRNVFGQYQQQAEELHHRNVFGQYKQQAEERCHKEEEDEDEYDYRREAAPEEVTEPEEEKKEILEQSTEEVKEAEERCKDKDDDEYEYRREADEPSERRSEDDKKDVVVTLPKRTKDVEDHEEGNLARVELQPQTTVTSDHQSPKMEQITRHNGQDSLKQEDEERCSKEDDDEYRREGLIDSDRITSFSNLHLINAELEASRIEENLDKAVIDLMDARQEVLSDLQGTRLREAEAESQPSNFPHTKSVDNQFHSQNFHTGPIEHAHHGGYAPNPHGQLHHQIIPQHHPHFPYPDGNSGQHEMYRNPQHQHQFGPHEATRDAAAHHHSFIHTHQHTYVHDPKNIHLPLAPIVGPSFNLNINQHAETAHPISHSSTSISQAVFPSITQVGPSHGIVNPQNPSAHFGSSADAIFSSHPSKFREVEEDGEVSGQPLLQNEAQMVSYHPEVEEIDLLSSNMNVGEELREADPTHKHKHKKQQSYQSYNYRPQQYYREAEQTPKVLQQEDPSVIPNVRQVEEMPEFEETNGDENFFVGSPTHKKKVKTKYVTKYYPVYPAYNKPQQYYREAEQADMATTKEDSFRYSGDPDFMVTSPHKKKKTKYHYDYVPLYLVPESSYYREADTVPTEASEHIPTSEVRESDVDSIVGTIKKKKNKKHYGYQPQYYQYYPAYDNKYYREANEPEAENRAAFDLRTTASPYLFNFRPQPYAAQYKRSANAEELSKTPKKNIYMKQQYGPRNEPVNASEDTQEQRRSKRSIPLRRLISDPHVKLDVPQTIENFGTVTKNAFEDERAPLYHVKHLVGSSKNALLSAMRVPPQNLIIPSVYEIVRSSEDEGMVTSTLDHDEDDPLGFSKTFKRVGEIVRDSVKSGQETAAHIGDIAHDARNIFHTARHAAPGLIIPYSQAPVLQKRPNKAVLVAPRILHVSQQRLGQKPSDLHPKFVRLGHIMDAVGISNPNARDLDLEKYTFESGRIYRSKVDHHLSNLRNRIRNTLDDDVESVGGAMDTLEDAKLSVGAKNLRDFLVKMRNELTSMVQSHPVESYHDGKTTKQRKIKEINKFVENLFDGNEVVPKTETRVGMTPESHPNSRRRAIEKEWPNFSQENEASLAKHRNQEQIEHNHSDLGPVVGAINPLMLQRIYNETVKIKKDGAVVPELLFRSNFQEVGPNNADENSVGTSMAMSEALLKPFMGQAQPMAVEKFYHTYGESGEVHTNEKD